MSKNKKKNTFARWAAVIAVLFLAGAAAPKSERSDSASESIIRETESTTASEQLEDESTTVSEQLEVESTLEVHFIDVGQGDSSLVICGGHALLIDAGNENKGTTVQMYLQKQNVTSLDAVIWTHPDADHIGGADVITFKYDIGTIYMPSVTADSKAYTELMEAIQYRNDTITVPEVGSSFDLGGATVTFLGPGRTYDDDNNNSIVCMVQFGDNKFLFTGDAEKAAEDDLVKAQADLTADVYQAGHHGSETSSSEKFLRAVNPTYAVISCGQDNSYGHPHAEVLERMRTMGVEVFRTDEQGSIIATSDGTNITWNTAPSDTWKAGEAAGGSSTDSSKVTDSPVVTDGGEVTDSLASTDSSKVTDSPAVTESEKVTDSPAATDGSKVTDSPAATDSSEVTDSLAATDSEIASDSSSQSSKYGTAPEGAVYIGNVSNNKLHKASCSGLPQSQNQVLFDTLEEAEAAGYTKDNQCKKCYPFGK